MEKPIAIYQYSIHQQIIQFAIFILLTGMMFWWFGVKEPMAFILPMGFVIIVFGLLSWYAWSKKEQTSLKIYKSGIYIHNEFFSWQEIKAVNIEQTDIDSSSYDLIVLKKNSVVKKCDLTFLNESHDVIYRSALAAFESYK